MPLGLVVAFYFSTYGFRTNRRFCREDSLGASPVAEIYRFHVLVVLLDGRERIIELVEEIHGIHVAKDVILPVERKHRSCGTESRYPWMSVHIPSSLQELFDSVGPQCAPNKVWEFEVA